MSVEFSCDQLELNTTNGSGGKRFGTVAVEKGFITIEQFGRGCFIDGPPTEPDVAAARRGLEQARRILTSGEYDVVILDEANIAAHFGLFSVQDLLELIEAKPDRVELVITGRRAHPDLVKRADLVTEMLDIKHYYHAGVQARKGIET